MLDPGELAKVAAYFGVSDDQVRRDHLISHLLAALSEHVKDDVVFFGGTALARTYLPEGRLSEDIDLLARGERSRVAATIESCFARVAPRVFGRLTWVTPLSKVSDVQHGIIRSGDGLTVRVQVLRFADYPNWETQRSQLVQRYADAPIATLSTLTRPSAVAAKVVAWIHRHSPRDLYDLWALGRIGAVDDEAAQVFARLGPAGGVPQPWMFDVPPTERAWTAELAAQTRLEVTAARALDEVRALWEAARTP
ncbi:MAG: nucleotidyl transferase AbiEii/AbiGii toxin family protein [Actinomycetes bacterium]